MTAVEDMVPAWTPEDEEAFEERVRRRGFDGKLWKVGYARESLGLAEPATPPTQLSFTATLGIAKRGRHRCPACRMRRVLFSIVATGNLFGGSEPRCSRCWGLR